MIFKLYRIPDTEKRRQSLLHSGQRLIRKKKSVYLYLVELVFENVIHVLYLHDHLQYSIQSRYMDTIAPINNEKIKAQIIPRTCLKVQWLMIVNVGFEIQCHLRLNFVFFSYDHCLLTLYLKLASNNETKPEIQNYKNVFVSFQALCLKMYQSM